MSRVAVLLLCAILPRLEAYRPGGMYPSIRGLSVTQTERALRDWAVVERNPERQRHLLHSVSTLAMLTASHARASPDPSFRETPVCLGVFDPYVSAVMVVLPHRNRSAVQLWILANHPLRPSAGTSLMNALTRGIADVQKQHTIAPRWWIPPP